MAGSGVDRSWADLSTSTRQQPETAGQAPWPRSGTPQDMNHRVFDRVDAVVGEHVWNFADFVTTPGIMRVGGNKEGRVHP